MGAGGARRCGTHDLAASGRRPFLGVLKMSDGNPTESFLERLRASKSEFDGSLRGEGNAAGIDWAKARASYEDLRRLAESGIGIRKRIASSRHSAYFVACTTWD